jgi:hypothetical protein
MQGVQRLRPACEQQRGLIGRASDLLCKKRASTVPRVWRGCDEQCPGFVLTASTRLSVEATGMPVRIASCVVVSG